MVIQERCPGGQVKVILGCSGVREEVRPSLYRLFPELHQSFCRVQGHLLLTLKELTLDSEAPGT